MAFTYLVIIQVLLLVTGLCSSNDAAQTPLKIGDCLMTDYLASMKKCETSFVKKLQGNKNANCSVAFSENVECVTAVAIDCYRALITDPKVLNATEKNVKTATKKLVGVFCEKGTLTYPKQLQNTTKIPGICGSDFFSNANKCTKLFNDQFKDDWTSAKLCRLYAEANQCVRKLFESKCNFDADIKEAVLKEYKKHYNPWCSSNKDPKEFIGENAAGTLSPYGTLLVSVVGACAVLMSL